MKYAIITIVILHIVAGFAWFIWKLEFQGKKKNDNSESDKTDQIEQ